MIGERHRMLWFCSLTKKSWLHVLYLREKNMMLDWNAYVSIFFLYWWIGTITWLYEMRGGGEFNRKKGKGFLHFEKSYFEPKNNVTETPVVFFLAGSQQKNSSFRLLPASRASPLVTRGRKHKGE